MSSLYQIAEKYLNFANMLEESEGEISPETLKELQSNEGDFKEKVRNYRHIIKNWEADIENGKKEKDRIVKFIQNRETNIERLKESLDWAMNTMGLDKYDMGVDGKISYRKSTFVDVDEDILPSKYFIKKVTQSPDKKTIADLLKNGQKIKGAYLKERQNIQVQ